MKRASIDIGSNSVLLLIAEVDGEKITEIVEEHAAVTALGKGLDIKKRFLQESMDATFEVLTHYSKLIQIHGIEIRDVVMTATEASRVALNSVEFYQMVEQKLGLKVHIISGSDEAFLTAKGVVNSSTGLPDEVVIMDIGGASTELIKVCTRPFAIIKSVSMPMGSVRVTDWISKGSLESQYRGILENYNLAEFQSEIVLGVAGTMTSLAGMLLKIDEFDRLSIDQKVVKITQVKALLEEIGKLSAEEILLKHPFLGKRAASMVGGIEVATKIGENINCKEFLISCAGLRFGTIIDEQFR